MPLLVPTYDCLVEIALAAVGKSVNRLGFAPQCLHFSSILGTARRVRPRRLSLQHGFPAIFAFRQRSVYGEYDA